MDHNEKLEKVLREDHAPDIDVNARKRSVNLAMAEFKTAEAEKKSKNSQGFNPFSRLMGKSTQSKGERKMETKFIYGGMAMAMVVVLAVGVSTQQLQEAVDKSDAHTAQLQSVSFGVLSTSPTGTPPPNKTNSNNRTANNFGNISANISSSTRSTPGILSGLGKLFSDDKAADQEIELSQAQTRPIPPGSAITSVQNADKPRRAHVEAIEQPNSKKLERARQEGQSAIHLMESDRLTEPRTQWQRPKEDRITMRQQNRDQFEKFIPNPFKQVAAEPVSTFSSDVDTASYSFVRKSINSGRLPNPNAVRVEEMINYFNYNYPQAQTKEQPFQPTVTVTDSPWAQGRKLMHIGIKGYELDKAELRSNLVFLLDVSGSMNQRDKLPLVKSSMKMLLGSLHPDDTVSIVTYAGRTGVVLSPTKASQSTTIMSAMNNLRAGGGTAGAAGIELAYQMAEQNFSENAVNRVILATDGDFNVGITNRNELKRYVERKREKGIFLSVLGFGQGNYNDHMMQTLAQNGNGVAAYIDTLSEARKVLVEEASSALFPIAKDVKFQVEFNPNAVAEYRLIGYETRSLKREDFNNDKIDAGDIGAGHTVTAIYEFVPVGSNARTIDPLRYGATQEKSIIAPPQAEEYAFLKMRYKLPTENTSKLITTPVKVGADEMSTDTAFATAVAAFGQTLKGGEHTGDFSYDDIIALAQSGKGSDPFGYRAEFINLVRMAKSLSR